jgi:hypothetical protein
VPRGVLLLSWLALGALASWAAAADREVIAPAKAVRTGSALGPAARSDASDSLSAWENAGSPRQVYYQGSGVQTTGYYAQHPNPNEPLGFSESMFAPRSGPLVDPGATPGVFDAPPVEFYESPDPEAPAPSASSGDWLRNGRWYAEQSVVYLERVANPKNDLRLAIEAINPFDLSENSLNVGLQLGYEPGLRSTIGRYLGRDGQNRDHSAEFTFLGLTHWQFGETITGVNAGSTFQVVDLAVSVPIYDNADFQGFDQTSDFNSYEFNYRIERRLGRDRMVYSRDSSWVRQATPSLLCAALAGVRVVIVNESLNWFAENAIGSGRYLVVTHNNLVGPQFGGELMYEHTYWRAGVRANGGALVNWASQSSTVRILENNGTPLSPNRDEFVKDHSLSFVGGLSFIGEYRFRPSFGLRVSYDMLWVTNLALAPNQITFLPSTPPEISQSHPLFYQGVSLGFEWYR